MKKKWEHGKAVVNGVLRYFSPSQVTTFDPDSYGGCHRRWYYEKVLGKRTPSTKAQERGTEYHKQIENYLRTGELVLSEYALAGKRFMPDPGPDLLLEYPIGDGTLKAGGILAVGFVDLIDARPETVREDGELICDPEGTIELVDWKFTSRMDSIKTPAQVANSVQMVTYCEWAARKTDAGWLRPSHVYFSTSKRQAVKRSVLVRREDLLPRWNKIEGLVRTMSEVASESDVEKVEAMTRSCSAWRGCPHRAYCSGGKGRTLADLFGVTAAKEMKLSLLDKLPTLKGTQEEKVAAAKAALAVPSDVREAVEFIAASSWGRPTLGGEALSAWCAVTGLDCRGAGYMGEGKLADLEIRDPAELVVLAGEIKGEESEVPALLPPDAPASDPAKASVSPEPTETAPVEEKPKKRGRKKKAEAEPAAIPAPAPVATPAPAGGITLLVDAITVGATDLSPWVQEIAKALAEKFDAPDLRCAPDQSPLSFGKWKGALAACVREEALSDGAYFLDTRGSEILEVAADALRSRAAVYVRGIR